MNVMFIPVLVLLLLYYFESDYENSANDAKLSKSSNLTITLKGNRKSASEIIRRVASK